jgi:hypothetical protein
MTFLNFVLAIALLVSLFGWCLAAHEARWWRDQTRVRQQQFEELLKAANDAQEIAAHAIERLKQCNAK